VIGLAFRQRAYGGQPFGGQRDSVQQFQGSFQRLPELTALLALRIRAGIPDTESVVDVVGQPTCGQQSQDLLLEKKREPV
jgi:hypothetical protein